MDNVIIILSLVALAAVSLPIAIVLGFLYRIETAATNERLQKQLARAEETTSFMRSIADVAGPALRQLIDELKPKRNPTQFVEVSFAEARAIMAADLIEAGGRHSFDYRVNLAKLLHQYVGTDLSSGPTRDAIADDVIKLLFGTELPRTE